MLILLPGTFPWIVQATKYFLKGKMHHESIMVLTIQFKIKDFSLTNLVSVFVTLFTYSEIIIPKDMNITIYG